MIRRGKGFWDTGNIHFLQLSGGYMNVHFVINYATVYLYFVYFSACYLVQMRFIKN